MIQNPISTLLPFRFCQTPTSVFTKASSSGLGLLLCALVTAHFNAAATEVYFTATIDQSPFTTQGYTVGSTVTGTFNYTPGTAPTSGSLNYTEYYNSDTMQVSFGAAQYNSQLGQIDAAHDIGIGSVPPYLDVYTVWGYALSGPSVQGIGPSDAEIQMIDSNHSVYATSPLPYGIDPPDSALFDNKTFTVSFDTDNVECTLDSIAVVPEPNSFYLLMISALLAMAFCTVSKTRYARYASAVAQKLWRDRRTA